MFLDGDEFISSISTYMIRKTDFVEFVIGIWSEFMTDLSKKINGLFREYDQFFERGGLN